MANNEQKEPFQKKEEKREDHKKRTPAATKKKEELLGVVLVAAAVVDLDAGAVYGFGGHGALGEDFDEVIVGILDEGDALHPAAVRRLVEGHAQFVEALAGVVDVGNRNAQVAEAALDLVAVGDAGGVGVSGVVERSFRFFGAVVPRDLHAARRRHAQLPARVFVVGDSHVDAVRDEINGETPLREVAVHEKLETQGLAIKLQRHFRVLHADHRLLHLERRRLHRLRSVVELGRVE
mmetsp:Transcript_25071/g.77381  ORF Transcript_25071/g.77381 Transcript_25071/m.77381 type:complete len:236 (+) Transcript_25071:224-931(+)